MLLTTYDSRAWHYKNNMMREIESEAGENSNFGLTSNIVAEASKWASS